MALCDCYKHFFPAHTCLSMKGSSYLKVGCKLMIVVLLTSGLIYLCWLTHRDCFISMEWKKSLANRILTWHMQVTGTGTKKGQNEVCELLHICFEGAAWSGCAVLFALVLQ